MGLILAFPHILELDVPPLFFQEVKSIPLNLDFLIRELSLLFAIIIEEQVIQIIEFDLFHLAFALLHLFIPVLVLLELVELFVLLHD
jgi:hypothetical protein